MSVVKATLIFSIATYLDVILNPLMCFITDSFYRTKLRRKFGRRRFFILTGIPLMLLYPMLWVKNMNFFYYLTTYILFEFVYTGVTYCVIMIVSLTFLSWTAYTFMADVDEVVTNRRREGVYAGAMTMAGKLMRASVVFILGQVLAAFGFVSGASTQPQSAVNAIAGVLLIGVGGLAIIGIVFSCRMKLNHKTHKIVIDELDRVHAGGRKEDVSEETRNVIEKLTGISYDKCFGNNNIGYKE